MKTILTLSLLLALAFNIQAQATKQHGTSSARTVINFSDTSIKDFQPSLLHVDQHPVPAAEYADKKTKLDQARAEHEKTQQKNIKKHTRANATDPAIVKGFQGNTSNGVPNDNDVAVSKEGKIVSVVNSNMRVYNDTGKSIYNKSMSSIFQTVGVFNQISDPRVLYDAKTDRFVLVCFSGSLSTSSTILVAFSQTNDPAGVWNTYKLNGNSFNDSTWSDYPIIALSDKDLFITFNQVKDNVSWTIGFKQSVIWQIDKEKGYAGDSLEYDLWSDIKYQGGFLRNICPAKYQTEEKGNNMYFLTVRNVADKNDSLFVTEISNSLQSGNAKLTQKVFKMPVEYGFPPNARQKKIGNAPHYLMTNDARVLAAVYENDYIHFGMNSINTEFMNAGVYLGALKNISTSSPSIEAQIFSTQEREFGYPCMAYMGNSALDHRVLFSFSHCITDSFPGTSVLYKDAYGKFSNILSVKEGKSHINMLTDSVERWGDYTNIQRMYHKPNNAVLAGSWGSGLSMSTWINEIANQDSSEAPLPVIAQDDVVFPNPITTDFSYQFTMQKAEEVSFELFDVSGKKVSLLLKTLTKEGKNKFSFSTKPLPAGIYIFKMSTKDKMLASEKVYVK